MRLRLQNTRCRLEGVAFAVRIPARWRPVIRFIPVILLSVPRRRVIPVIPVIPRRAAVAVGIMALRPAVGPAKDRRRADGTDDKAALSSGWT